MTITTTKIERDIRQLEQRLQFLRQLRQYLRDGIAISSESTPTPTLEVGPTPSPLTEGIEQASLPGVQATILRKLADGAGYPDELARWFREDQRKSVMNSLGRLRRLAFIRDTSKGRVELTTKGFEEAQWFAANPGMKKHISTKKAKNA